MASTDGQEDRRCVYDPLVELMARFEKVKATEESVDPFEGLPVEARLKKHIVDGIKKNLERDLDDALQAYEPLAIINDLLLGGMKTVGELFGAGQMQLPFVLQSAEVMKTAVAYLEPMMDRVNAADKGAILLATVAGDVHDIGKNLVDIILSNNGYRVVNIGIKQPINAILDKAQEHRCDVIGLSGLLVKSTLVMRDALVEMNERGLSGFPVILGGAALTRAYVEQDLRAVYNGAVYYAQDAFEGLRLMGELCGGVVKHEEDALPEPDAIAPGRFAKAGEEGVHHGKSRQPDAMPERYVFEGVRSAVRADVEPPKLPFYGPRACTQFEIERIYEFINTAALWRGQWQFRRDPKMSFGEYHAWLEEKVHPVFDRMMRELASVLAPAVKWGYFPCQSDGNDLVIYGEDARTERCRFRFPRQPGGKRLCLADYFRSADSGVMDVVGLSVVTMGPEVSRREQALFEKGEFREYLFTHGMGVETAEALAEFWHKRMRAEMGIDGEDAPDVKGLLGGKYRGARYSFGYPACPNLEAQAQVLDLLQAQEIGVELTESLMLTPEQSTSAVIVHHPEARYFNVR